MSEKQSPGRIGQETTLRSAIRGLAISQMLGAACQLGLPDAVGVRDRIGITDLADRLGCHRGTLYRLVRTLAALGVFAIDAEGTVSHTDASRDLRGDAAAPQHLAARFWTLPAVWAAWGKLGEAVRTGRAAFPLANGGRTFFGHLGEAPADQRLFRSFMQSGFAGRHEAVAEALTLAEAETVVDVGGGSGALLRAILTRHPGARGILYDRPEVIAGAPAVLDTPELQERCDVIGGDFFRSVPAGGTTYLLCWILHDWPDEAAAMILRSMRAAMPDGARLVIVDRLLDADPGQCDAFDLLEDVNMLVLLGGRERTEAEFNDLMAASGFAPITPVLVQPRFSLLETRPDSPATGGAQGWWSGRWPFVRRGQGSGSLAPATTAADAVPWAGAGSELNGPGRAWTRLLGLKATVSRAARSRPLSPPPSCPERRGGPASGRGGRQASGRPGGPA